MAALHDDDESELRSSVSTRIHNSSSRTGRVVPCHRPAQSSFFSFSFNPPIVCVRTHILTSTLFRNFQERPMGQTDQVQRTLEAGYDGGVEWPPRLHGRERMESKLRRRDASKFHGTTQVKSARSGWKRCCPDACRSAYSPRTSYTNKYINILVPFIVHEEVKNFNN